MAVNGSSWKLHYDIEKVVPEDPLRVGYAEIQVAIDRGQRGRVKRAVSTMVGLQVLAWAGQRKGRAVCQGPRTLADVIAEGLMPMPDREIETYPLLLAPVDDHISRWHKTRGHIVDESGGENSFGDGATSYITSSVRAAHKSKSSAHTRPDITVVVDLEFSHLGPWNDIHAIEVKPYWAINRSALFETAAQAALGRCSFSWLLAWIPDPNSGHFSRPQVELIEQAKALIDSLASEANELGLGFLLAEDLSEDARLIELAEPRRQAMDPVAADQLFASLGRTDGSQIA